MVSKSKRQYCDCTYRKEPAPEKAERESEGEARKKKKTRIIGCASKGNWLLTREEDFVLGTHDKTPNVVESRRGCQRSGGMACLCYKISANQMLPA